MSKITNQSVESTKKFDPIKSPFVIVLATILIFILYISYGIVSIILRMNSFSVRNFVAEQFWWIGFTLGALAMMLSRFKNKQQFWYGMFEIVFGYYSIGVVIVKLQSTVLKNGVEPFAIIGSLSAVYLLIRGLGNITDGHSKPFLYKENLKKYL